MKIASVAKQTCESTGEKYGTVKTALQRKCERGEIKGAKQIKSPGGSGKTWDISMEEAGKFERERMEKMGLLPKPQQKVDSPIQREEKKEEKKQQENIPAHREGVSIENQDELNKRLFERSIDKYQAETQLKIEQTIEKKLKNLYEEKRIVEIGQVRETYRKGMEIFFSEVREFTDRFLLKNSLSPELQAQARTELEKTFKKSIEKIKNEFDRPADIS